MKAVIKEASDIIEGARNQQYGKAENSFSRIADYWTNYLKHTGISTKGVSEADVGMLMILLKIAREEFEHKHDNIVDIIGYAALVEEMFVHDENFMNLILGKQLEDESRKQEP